MALVKGSCGVTGLISRSVRDVQWMQKMGKKDKLKLTRLEGEEAKYFNSTLIEGRNEPEYLRLLKPPTPYHSLLNLKLECPDFAILEKYTSFIARRSRILGVKIDKYWPLQHLDLQYDILKHEDSIIDKTLLVKVYRRVLRMREIQATILPMLVQVIDASKPPGLDYCIFSYTEEDEKARYVVDTSLFELQAKLEEIKADLDTGGKKKQ